MIKETDVPHRHRDSFVYQAKGQRCPSRRRGIDKDEEGSLGTDISDVEITPQGVEIHPQGVEIQGAEIPLQGVERSPQGVEIPLQGVGDSLQGVGFPFKTEIPFKVWGFPQDVEIFPQGVLHVLPLPSSDLRNKLGEAKRDTGVDSVRVLSFRVRCYVCFVGALYLLLLAIFAHKLACKEFLLFDLLNYCTLLF